MNHIKKLQALGACDESIEFAAQFSHAQKAWENNTRPDWALWLLARLGGEHKRMAVRLAADFAERVVHLAGEGRPAAEAAIAAARAWADNPCEKTQSAALRAAYDARAAAYDARAAAYDARAAAYAADAADAAADAAAYAAAYAADAADAAAYAADAADAAAYAAAYATYTPDAVACGCAAAYAVDAAAEPGEERAWQISRIREICPNCPIGEVGSRA
jgi:hypothetical protein